MMMMTMMMMSFFVLRDVMGWMDREGVMVVGGLG